MGGARTAPGRPGHLGVDGPRHLFAFGMRHEDGLTHWALLVSCAIDSA
jgi:hypothetical protein